MPLPPLASYPLQYATTTLTPSEQQWYTKLVLKVNDLASGGGSFDAGNLTGTTLAANVVNSSLIITDGQLSSNVALKNGTNAFTGANSFANNPIDLLVGQLQFPATPNPSANANTMDDYRETTWTPADVSGAGLALTFTANNFLVLKWGQGVLASFRITYPVTADGALNLIGGLPAVAQTQTNSPFGGFLAGTTLGVNPQVRVIQGQSQLTFINPATNAQYTNAALSAATLQGAVIYRAAA